MSLSPSEALGKGAPFRPTFSLSPLMNYPLPYKMKCKDLISQVLRLGPAALPFTLLCLQMTSFFAERPLLRRQWPSEQYSNISAVHQVRYPTYKNRLSFLVRMSLPTQKKTIKQIFPVPDLQPSTKHLGHPLIFNHNDRTRAYNFIYGKFRAKLTTVRANKLNHAGRLTYIQSVLSSIPVYYMSTILFSKSFVQKITTIIRRFWWTGVQEDNPTSPIAYRSWDDICQSKENGGLGIRDLETVNKSLIIHAAYNIANNKNPFLTSVLKAKYYPNSSFWTANNSGTRSIFWSSVMQVKKELHNNAVIQLHAGNSSIWSSPWCPLWGTIHDHLLLPVTVSPLPSTAAELWNPNTHEWDMHLLSNIFDTDAVQAISSTHPVPSDLQDVLRWKTSKTGVCTTKEIYKTLSAANVTQLPQQGSRSILPPINSYAAPGEARTYHL